MATNPDNDSYIGFGPQGKMLDTEGNEMSLDSRYMIPVQHQLRFIQRGVPTDNPEVLQLARILQQYQWSQSEGKFDWYDIPLVDDD